MVNPDKYIRTAYVNLCAQFLPTWEMGIPKTVTMPPMYALITNQTRNETERNKDGHEWLCTVTIDLNSVQPAGYFGSDELDDIEQSIMNVIEGDLLVVPGFMVKETRLVQSQPLSGTNSTVSITRKVFTYEHWLDNVD